MANRAPIAINEWYHCYNRGVDKRKIFQTKNDYERFLLLMYIGNSGKQAHVANLKEKNLHKILNDNSFEKGEPIVEIGAWCLMPNHFHFVLREIQTGGIALFMQKLSTGYTVYFNNKNERTGSLFGGTFKSKHIPDDRYLKHLISYLHLNPVELWEPKWKQGHGNISAIQKKLLEYPYSSLIDFLDRKKRFEIKLLGDSVFDLFDLKPSLEKMTKEAQEYYENYQG